MISDGERMVALGTTRDFKKQESNNANNFIFKSDYVKIIRPVTLSTRFKKPVCKKNARKRGKHLKNY